MAKRVVIIKKPTHSGLFTLSKPINFKYLIQLTVSISHPAGAANQVLEKAIKDDKSAY